MKAIVCGRYGAPEVLEIAEISLPELEPRDILIQVAATTVTSSDSYIRGFSAPWHLKPLMGLVLGFRKPRQAVLGMVCSGTVKATGPQVHNFMPGQAVVCFDRFGFGCHAEYKRIRETGLVVPKPDNLTHIKAAGLVYGGLLARFYLKKGEYGQRKNILIIGASGAVGSAAVQLSKLAGCHVTGVCGPKNLEYVGRLGADQVVDYQKDCLANLNPGFDLIFDAVPAGARQATSPQTLAHLLSAHGRYLTVQTGSPSFQPDDLRELLAAYSHHQIKPGISHIMPLDDIIRAYTIVESWHKQGNLVLTVG